MQPLPTVDVCVLSRDHSALDPRVESAIRLQQHVRCVLHRIVARPREADRNRIETIARGRNQAKSRGQSPWLMFVDDDVVLDRDCVAKLLANLEQRPAIGALAAWYRNEHALEYEQRRHVTMGATLFRRSALNQIRFRTRPGWCECLCCCVDLRSRGIGIGYLPGLKAEHIKLKTQHAINNNSNSKQYVLAGFDGRHLKLFQTLFLPSLRESGNNETVLAVTSGLTSSERRGLHQSGNVAAMDVRVKGSRHIATDRFKHFAEILRDIPRGSKVAFWDAGDVVFQKSLKGLWKQVEENTSKVAVVAEPWSHRTISARDQWISTTRELSHEIELRRILRHKPIINGGFAAGYVEPMRHFLLGTDRWIHSPKLRGTGSFNQIAMGSHCFTSNCHVFVDAGWNYCLAGRPTADAYVAKDGNLTDRKTQRRIAVVHGNGKTLARYNIRPRSPIQS